MLTDRQYVYSQSDITGACDETGVLPFRLVPRRPIRVRFRVRNSVRVRVRVKYRVRVRVRLFSPIETETEDWSFQTILAKNGGG